MADIALFLKFSRGSMPARRVSADDSGPEIRKAGRLGNDRPSLGARLGMGLSKPWGVWEGGFDEAAWGPLGGLGGTLMGAGALGWGTLPNWDEIPFGYELRRRTMISNERNLTNRPRPRHLQNCISASGDFHRIPMFRA